jgi:hypothetical protein
VTDTPLKPGDHVEIIGGSIHEGLKGKLIAEPTTMYCDEGEMRALVSVEVPNWNTVSPLVSQLRRIPAPVADEITAAAAEAAALAIHNLSCPTFDDPSAGCAGVNHEDREQAAAAIGAYRPHLLAERDAENTRLRTENEQLRAAQNEKAAAELEAFADNWFKALQVALNDPELRDSVDSEGRMEDIADLHRRISELRGVCTGADDCTVPIHVHGCYADRCEDTGTACDEPASPSAPAQEGTP